MWFLMIPEVNVFISTGADRSPHFIYLFIFGSSFFLHISLYKLTRIHSDHSFHHYQQWFFHC